MRRVRRIVDSSFKNILLYCWLYKPEVKGEKKKKISFYYFIFSPIRITEIEFWTNQR